VIVASLSAGRRKWIFLVVFLVVVVLGFLGAIVFFFPPKKEYVVLREIPVTTYYLRTETSTATLSRTVVLSSAFLSAITRASVINPITVTRYSLQTLNLPATTTNTLVTVIGNTTYTMLTRTFVYTYVFTTSVPEAYVLGIPTVITETTTRWTSFNQTTVLTTTITFTGTSTSTYTRTVWTTVTAPPGAAVISPTAPNQAKGFAELAFCSVLVAGMLVFRKRSISPHHTGESVQTDFARSHGPAGSNSQESS